MPRPVAMVTGPTSGIGREFARQLAAKGHDLVLVSRDADRLAEVAAELRERYDAASEIIAADLADRTDLARVEARLAGSERPVDLLVNNAGTGQKRPFLENSVEEEQRMLDVLVTAVLRLSHAALVPMVARGSGAIINVSSLAGYLPRGTYSAAKAYVTSLSEWADLTYRDSGVRVMALLPGLTRTEFHQRLGVNRQAPRWMWLVAERVVREALTDLDKGKRISVPTRRYKMLAGVSKYTRGSLGSLRRYLRLSRK